MHRERRERNLSLVHLRLALRRLGRADGLAPIALTSWAVHGFVCVEVGGRLRSRYEGSFVRPTVPVPRTAWL